MKVNNFGIRYKTYTELITGKVAKLEESKKEQNKKSENNSKVSEESNDMLIKIMAIIIQ